ncbi:hypothetical protein EV198_2885 [Roseivirga ehrenbergii]|uniref:Uncharacterized protein n=1 Tax=Roseivirga ehrenbergii (strain DSM 102268 / JCM 13514 / KCTC 12282 / NCIMB 14502 / KMM 6017) TaxID=279360 RepID=A0A150XQJ8_ROSEK|nr:hypothetical protein [Roseivirga ehrenbergii]KYG81006.1 hypothetical protein MB14_14580 [Roseivirga ehrenbergii]TCL00869.1 hypothetical protein EV198_2885 [Roseivirga ehrenbergii]
MRYLNESEILPYIHAGKEIEQYLGSYYHNDFRCVRYVTLGKDKVGYYGLLFELFDDSCEGVESIYDYSSVEPDNLNGIELGSFESFRILLEYIGNIAELDSNKYLISGQLDEEIKERAK